MAALFADVISAAVPARNADLDTACYHLGIFPFADEIELGGADGAVARELAHLARVEPYLFPAHS